MRKDPAKDTFYIKKTETFIIANPKRIARN